MRRTNQLLLSITLTCSVAACASAGREAAWEKDEQVGQAGTGTSTSAAMQIMDEAMAAWKKRDDKAQVLVAIEKWEQAAKENPANAEAQIWLSRAYYFLVDGHLNNEQPADLDELRLSYHQKGSDWGEKALIIIDRNFESAMRAGGEFEDAIKQIGKDAVPAAYWYCTNLSRFANAKGLSAKLFYKDRVAAAMERIKEIDPTYFYAGPDRYFGAFYSALPSIAGKDLDKSRAHFEVMMQIAPQYLPSRVVQAEFLAVETDDAAMYERLLREVINGDDTQDEDIAPENRAAKRTAKRMLQEIDEVF